MRKDDLALMMPADIPAALGLLTRLPVRVDTANATARGVRTAWAWPLAGMAVGLMAGLVAATALWIGLPPTVAALLLITIQIAATGAMHEDGLADSLDGLWGGWDPARRLAIMKDSRIGAYGVIALVLTLILRWQLWALLIAAGHLWGPVIAVAALSRVPMVALMWALPHARAGGLSHAVGRPATATLALAAGVALIIAVGTLGWVSLSLAIALTAATLIWGTIARAKIGGQTGDILGAAQQFAEIAALCLLVV